jgi:hypothetical protein
VVASNRHIPPSRRRTGHHGISRQRAIRSTALDRTGRVPGKGSFVVVLGIYLQLPRRAAGHYSLHVDGIAPIIRAGEEVPVMAVRVTEHQCQRVRCPGCGALPVGELPPSVAASAFGPRLQAALVISAPVRN